MSSSPNLAEILGKISDGICVLGKDREVSFMNEKASQILNAADGEFDNKISQAVKNQASTRFEHFHASLNRWFEHQTYTGADGGVTLISRDITSRRRIEEALRASEERFRRVIESNIIGVIVVENGLITEANDVFLRMTGYNRTDLMTRQMLWREMTPSEFEGPDAKARGELETSGGFSPYEKEFFRKDGSRVPTLIGGVATDNKPDGHEMLCLVLDLSERRHAEQRVLSIVECSKILASSLECERTFPELAQFIASKMADSCAIFIREDDELLRVASADSSPATSDANLDASKVLESDIRRVISSGQTEMLAVPVSRVLMPISAGDPVQGVLVIGSARVHAFDADDLQLFEVFARRAGLALVNTRLYHEAQKANRLKDEFVAIVSHELRTPLTPILGAVYMMRSEPQDERIFNRALDLIERNAKAQVRIVDDLLDVSRAISGKLRLNMESIDLCNVVQAAVDTVRPAGEAKNIRLEVRGLSAAVVSGDGDRLQQVVWNLLANSVKFTPPGGHIVIELAESTGHIEIRVTDTGIGIDAEFLPHVFDRFRQADTSRTRVHGGLGLGLAIVRHLVESHGGTVHAHSSGGEQGSTFVVRLPLKPAFNAASRHATN